jgi:hypothetical protein
VPAQGELQLQGESQLKQLACALKKPPLTRTSKIAIPRISFLFILSVLLSAVLENS